MRPLLGCSANKTTIRTTTSEESKMSDAFDATNARLDALENGDDPPTKQ